MLSTCDFSPTHVQKYVAYLDLGNGMTEAAMERWASTGTVPGKHYPSNLVWPCAPCILCTVLHRRAHLSHFCHGTLHICKEFYTAFTDVAMYLMHQNTKTCDLKFLGNCRGYQLAWREPSFRRCRHVQVWLWIQGNCFALENSSFA